MTTRTITGTVLRLDGTPWASGRVRFELVESGYDLQNQYPRQRLDVQTTAAGTFSALVWCNQGTLNRAKVAVWLPNEIRPFFIVVPPGPPVDVSILRAAQEIEPGQTQYTALVGYIASLAAGGSTGAADALTAGEPLPAFRAVALGPGLLLDLCDPSEARRLLGVTPSAVATGATVRPVDRGPLTNPAWSWTLGSPVWVGPGGSLVQVEQVGLNRIVGYPVSPQTLLIQIGEPYETA